MLFSLGNPRKDAKKFSWKSFFISCRIFYIGNVTNKKRIMALFSKEQSEMIKFLNGGIAPHGCWRYDAEKDLVNIWGDFNCEGQGLKDFKGVKFGKIEGHFNCSNNELTSLEGSPRYVVKSFDCSNNKLTSLEGGPDKVWWGDYKCSKNQLVSLNGLPKEASHGGLKIDCSNNKLKSLETIGNTDKIAEFFCRKNEIISLDGAPVILGYSYHGIKEHHISYYGNRGVSGKVLDLIHFTMAEKKVPYLIALGILKDQIKAGDLKKLIPESDNASEVIKGASMIGRFLNP
jgi:hypothetical protein